MADSAPEIFCTIIGLDPQLRETVLKQLPECKVTEMAIDLEKLIEPLNPAAHFVIVGQPPAEIPAAEVAQALRMNQMDLLIFYVCAGREGYDQKTLVKNGFSDSFLLPLDLDAMKTAIRESIGKASSGKIKVYRSVKLVDIDPGTKLNFDVAIYLPANKKYINYSAAGDDIDKDRLEKLKGAQMKSLHVPSHQIQEFYNYSANRLKELGNNTTMSETERRDKMQQSVRSLMGGMFSDSNKDATFEKGKAMVSDCQNIVKSYVMATDAGEWYKRLTSVSGEMGDSYSHATNVSTYAALFSMGLGIGKPEDMALAGLLHDIGLADVPIEILEKPESERTREGQELYQKHPEYSVNMIKNRKLLVPEIVTKAIMQHHELHSGKGYPKAMPGDRICKEAQVLKLADDFDYLTTVHEGQKTMTPPEVLDFYEKQLQTLAEHEHKHDPKLLTKFIELFKSQMRGEALPTHEPDPKTSGKIVIKADKPKTGAA